MKTVTKIAAAGFIAFGMGTSAFAATDGTLGATSQGDLDITLSIADTIQISDFDDIALGAYSGTGDLNGNDDLCVYRNDAGGQYTITATATEGSFKVVDGAEEITYEAYFNDVTGTTGEALLVYNTPTATQTNANTASADCSSGGLRANVHVKVLEADLQAANPGSYSGTLILTASPV